MAMRIEVFKTKKTSKKAKDFPWFWRLTAANGHIIARCDRGQAYKSNTVRSARNIRAGLAKAFCQEEKDLEDYMEIRVLD